MREFTQTTVAPDVGNCWQTAVACILEIEPAALPDQRTNDYVLVDGKWTGRSYNNPLQGYLRKHHGLAYVELYTVDEVLGLLDIRSDAFHLMTGRTVRSDSFGGMRHVVVGRRGKMVWDPHPSRAGLTDAIRWAFLVPFPAEWSRSEAANINPCVCPACVTP